MLLPLLQHGESCQVVFTNMSLLLLQLLTLQNYEGCVRIFWLQCVWLAFIEFANAAGTLEAISLNVGENLRSRPTANAALMLPKSSNFNCNWGLQSIRLQLAKNGLAKSGKVLDNLCAEYQLKTKSWLIDRFESQWKVMHCESEFTFGMTGICCLSVIVEMQQQHEVP